MTRVDDFIILLQSSCTWIIFSSFIFSIGDRPLGSNWICSDFLRCHGLVHMDLVSNIFIKYRTPMFYSQLYEHFAVEIRKRNLYQYSQRFCFCWCWANSSSVSHVRNMDLPRSPFSSEVLPSTRLPPLNLLSSEFEEHSQQRFESLYGRNEAELKFSRQNCDSRHFEQTRRLEKLRSAQQRKRSSAELVSMSK